MTAELTVAMLGFGAIGRSLAALIRERLPHVRLTGIAKRSPPSAQDRAAAPAGTPFVATPAEFLQLPAQLVIECAGHAALAAYAPDLLREGRDLLIASVGALASRACETALREAALAGRARLLLSTGAIGAVDLLCAARLGGLRTVHYTGSKPPRAWLGTAGEARAQSAAAEDAPVVLFEGTAREAALQFPQNANVAATVALAGVGFEETRVRLVADRRLEANQHAVHAAGTFGRFELNVCGNAESAQPKTSVLVAFSLARYLADTQSVLRFA